MTQTLLDAQVEFEREFKSVRHDPKAERVIYLFTGGTVEDPLKTPPPVLCSTHDLAVEMWLQAARTATNDRANTVLTWRAPPRFLKFQMTMTGKHNQDRVVTDRYCVYSEVAFSL
jgi:hypothetical protein